MDVAVLGVVHHTNPIYVAVPLIAVALLLTLLRSRGGRRGPFGGGPFGGRSGGGSSSGDPSNRGPFGGPGGRSE
jgi:hypothetical protein